MEGSMARTWSLWPNIIILRRTRSFASTAARAYLIYLIGFMPGFPYMGELPEGLVTPRLKTPRLSVPAGSVAIAQKQTGIYPMESPGGWQILGRTPVRMFDPGKTPPSYLRMGDRVQFYPISEKEFEEWKESVEAFEVLEPGILTTVQDLGRFGFSQVGVPPSGALDPFSLRVGNLLVGNEEGEAGLETTIMGLKLKAMREVVIAVTGGDLFPTLNGESLEMWRSHLLVEGDILAFKGVRRGCRAYLCLRRRNRRPQSHGKQVHLPFREIWRLGG